ncbi:MAG TPA: hypothetical protein VGD63_05235 [Steroidobacteraceae bacterium]
MLALESALERLTNALSHGNFPAHTQSAATDRGATRKICETCSTIDYEMDDEVNQSPVCLGVVGVNTDTIKGGEAVNHAKAEFKAICTLLQGIRVRIPEYMTALQSDLRSGENNVDF